MTSLVDVSDPALLDAKQDQAVLRAARAGPGNGGLFRRRGFRLSGVGRAPGAGRQRAGRNRGFGFHPGVAQARCRGLRAAVRNPHEYIETREFENPDYLKNDANRCFHCKDELFTRLEEVGRERGIPNIVYGVNADDLGDYRPGQNAAGLHQVKAPLVEAGLRKAEIRELSRMAGLPTWDRPASACLSSRIPYGTPVTIENIKTVERGEEEVKALGFRQFRVRYHGELVRTG
jgi:uncharacterized protein (TIGR00268 family)